MGDKHAYKPQHCITFAGVRKLRKYSAEMPLFFPPQEYDVMKTLLVTSDTPPQFTYI